MSPRGSDGSSVRLPTQDVIYAAHTLIAASGIVREIFEEHAAHGQITAGALVHVANIIDKTIERLGLDTLAVEQEELPF